MAKMTWLERRYRRAHLECVRHITIDPRGPGVVRIHMIPPRTEDAGDPFLLLLNGAQLVPLNLSWAILLANFMDQLEPWSGREIGQEDWQSMLSAEGHPPHLSRHRPGRAAGGPGADAAQHRGHRPGPGAAGGGGHPVSGRIRRPHVRPPPDGPDDQRHDPGGRVALQPEVPALLCRRAGPGPAAGADHGPVEGPSGEAPPGQYPPGDLHRRRAHPAAGPGGAGGGGPVVRHPAEHQRPPADAGAVPGSVRGQPGQRPGDSVRCRRRRSQRPGGGGGLR